MSPSAREYAITGAVLVGALVLVGPLAFGVLVVAVELLAAFAGASLSGPAGVLIYVAAALVALQVVTEVTAVRLHGYDALSRGTRERRLARTIMLSVTAAAGLVTAAAALFSVVPWAVTNRQVFTLTLAVMVLGGLLVTLVRAVRAFRGGLGEGGRS